jgi:hypothetical protein
VSLEFRPELWAQIEARFARFGRKATENNRKQAYVPAGAVALENPVGTAPCFIVEHDGGAVISLPGVPRELEYMLEHAVLPYLRQHVAQPAVIRSRTLRTVGIGESLIDARIAELEELSNPTVGLAAHPGQTDVRITAKAATAEEADALLDPLEADLRGRLGDFIYVVGTAEVEEVLAELLAQRGQGVAVGEFGTDGDVGKRLAALPAADKVYRGSMLSSDANASASDLAAGARGGAEWGLGVRLNLAANPPIMEVALAGAQGVETQVMGFGGHPGLAVRWIGTAALNVLRLKLIRSS